MLAFRYQDFRNFALEFVSSHSMLRFFAVMYLALGIALAGIGLAL